MAGVASAWLLILLLLSAAEPGPAAASSAKQLAASASAAWLLLSSSLAPLLLGAGLSAAASMQGMLYPMTKLLEEQALQSGLTQPLLACAGRADSHSASRLPASSASCAPLAASAACGLSHPPSAEVATDKVCIGNTCQAGGGGGVKTCPNQLHIVCGIARCACKHQRTAARRCYPIAPCGAAWQCGRPGSVPRPWQRHTPCWLPARTTSPHRCGIRQAS